jgi:hypothetical protein
MNLLVTAAAAAASSVALPTASQAGPADLANPDWIAGASFAAKQGGRAPGEGSFPEYPPEIFGKLPDGFVLDNQPIEMLCFWHRKAIDVIDQFLARSPDSEARDEGLAAYCEIKNRILAAVLSAHAARPGQVAAQLRAAVTEIDHLSTATCPASIEEVLEARDIVKLSAELTEATVPIVPKKRVGALQRGRKLTRAGLLTRYQSFLVQELETVSWNLYGERNYAKQTIFFDDAVRARCLSSDSRDPFFDERSLPTRARAVLKSLEIDTETVDARAEEAARKAAL